MNFDESLDQEIIAINSGTRAIKVYLEPQGYEQTVEPGGREFIRFKGDFKSDPLEIVHSGKNLSIWLPLDGDAEFVEYVETE